MKEFVKVQDITKTYKPAPSASPPRAAMAVWARWLRLR